MSRTWHHRDRKANRIRRNDSYGWRGDLWLGALREKWLALRRHELRDGLALREPVLKLKEKP